MGGRSRPRQAGAVVADPPAPHPLFGPLAAVCLLGGAGLLLAAPRLPPTWLWGAAGLLGLCLLARAWRWRWAGIALLGAALAAAQAQSALEAQLPPGLAGRTLWVEGRVLDLPRREPRRIRFDLQVDAGATQDPALRGRRLRLAWYLAPGERAPALAAGSRWRLPVRLQAPRGLRNPGGIDGEKHALIDRIAASGHVAAPALARPLAPATGVQAWRERMSARIGRAVAAPSARFVQALALGATGGLRVDD